MPQDRKSKKNVLEFIVDDDEEDEEDENDDFTSNIRSQRSTRRRNLTSRRQDEEVDIAQQEEDELEKALALSRQEMQKQAKISELFQEQEDYIKKRTPTKDKVSTFEATSSTDVTKSQASHTHFISAGNCRERNSSHIRNITLEPEDNEKQTDEKEMVCSTTHVSTLANNDNVDRNEDHPKPNRFKFRKRKIDPPQEPSCSKKAKVEPDVPEQDDIPMEYKPLHRKVKSDLHGKPAVKMRQLVDKRLLKCKRARRHFSFPKHLYAPEDVDPNVYTNVVIAMFEQYRLALKVEQSKCTRKVLFGPPIKPGYHVSNTLDATLRYSNQPIYEVYIGNEEEESVDPCHVVESDQSSSDSDKFLTIGRKRRRSRKVLDFNTVSQNEDGSQDSNDETVSSTVKKMNSVIDLANDETQEFASQFSGVEGLDVNVDDDSQEFVEKEDSELKPNKDVPSLSTVQRDGDEANEDETSVATEVQVDDDALSGDDLFGNGGSEDETSLIEKSGTEASTSKKCSQKHLSDECISNSSHQGKLVSEPDSSPTKNIASPEPNTNPFASWQTVDRKTKLSGSQENSQDIRESSQNSVVEYSELCSTDNIGKKLCYEEKRLVHYYRKNLFSKGEIDEAFCVHGDEDEAEVLAEAEAEVVEAEAEAETEAEDVDNEETNEQMDEKRTESSQADEELDKTGAASPMLNYTTDQSDAEEPEISVDVPQLSPVRSDSPPIPVYEVDNNVMDSESELIEDPESPQQGTECPLCGVMFPQTEIEVHAAECDGTVPVKRTRPAKAKSAFSELIQARKDRFGRPKRPAAVSVSPVTEGLGWINDEGPSTSMTHDFSKVDHDSSKSGTKRKWMQDSDSEEESAITKIVKTQNSDSSSPSAHNDAIEDMLKDGIIQVAEKRITRRQRLRIFQEKPRNQAPPSSSSSATAAVVTRQKQRVKTEERLEQCFICHKMIPHSMYAQHVQEEVDRQSAPSQTEDVEILDDSDDESAKNHA